MLYQLNMQIKKEGEGVPVEYTVPWSKFMAIGLRLDMYEYEMKENEVLKKY